MGTIMAQMNVGENRSVAEARVNWGGGHGGILRGGEVEMVIGG